jgi:hypothetical protein
MVVQKETEVADSLRRIQPQGSLFMDRYHSVTARNLVEPKSSKKGHSTTWIKTYEKQSFKNFS